MLAYSAFLENVENLTIISLFSFRTATSLVMNAISSSLFMIYFTLFNWVI